MATLRPAIVLTGFGAFPGVKANATAALVPELAAAARAAFPHRAFIDKVLPVEWLRAPQELDELISHPRVRVALHFGVSREARGFQIELVGRNVCEARRDAAGALPTAAHVIADAPQVLTSTFPAERIVSRLEKAGLPCVTSTSAGHYLCNALLYHSLDRTRRLGRPLVTGFVHLPANLSPTPGWLSRCRLTWNEALAGGMEIIAACVEAESIA